MKSATRCTIRIFDPENERSRPRDFDEYSRALVAFIDRIDPRNENDFLNRFYLALRRVVLLTAHPGLPFLAVKGATRGEAPALLRAAHAELDEILAEIRAAGPEAIPASPAELRRFFRLAEHISSTAAGVLERLSA